jgi:hypothetical protein
VTPLPFSLATVWTMVRILAHLAGSAALRLSLGAMT